MKTSELIGKRIKDKRTELGMSQDELAAKLGYSGKSMISLIESGKRDLSTEQLVQLTKVFGCSAGDIIDDLEPNNDDLSVLIDRLTPEQKEAVRNFLQAMLGDK